MIVSKLYPWLLFFQIPDGTALLSDSEDEILNRGAEQEQPETQRLIDEKNN